ncbi:hypothetical protein WJX82_008902 [Trebouxia sp. C0006]
MDEMTSLPMLSVPHDSFRHGLGTLKDDIGNTHVVEAIQRNHPRQQEQIRLEMMRNVYGSALPARMALEKQILGRVQRLPGIESSRLGLDSLSGKLDEFEFDSYLNTPNDREDIPTDMHSLMEAQLKLQTKPASRGI